MLGDELPHETFESAAIDYLEEVRKVQPEGPYILAGFCSGGTIAYEMAQQLIDEGEKVSHIVMLDTIATDWREILTRKDKIEFHKTMFKKTGIAHSTFGNILKRNRISYQIADKLAHITGRDIYDFIGDEL